MVVSEAQSGYDIGCLYCGAIVLENLPHWTTRFYDLIRRKALANEVIPRDLAVRKVYVGDVVDDPPINLFRHSEVEGPVARFHVKDRDFSPLRRDRCK